MTYMRPNLQPIQILIVDAHAVVRRGLRMVLDLQPDIQVVGEAGRVADAQQLLLSLRPDLLLFDLQLPDENGLALCSWAQTLAPHMKLLVLTGTATPQRVQAAVDAGVHGYVLKEVAPAELASAIRQVAAGKQALHPAVAPHVRYCQHAPPRTSPPPQLTPREMDVLTLMTTTATNREIADQLMLAEETVRSHVKNILRKLNARNRTQAVVAGLRLNYIHLHE